MTINNKINKYSFLLVVIFCLIAIPVFSWAEEGKIKAPETLEEIKSFLKRFLELLPGAMKESWQRALVFWQRIFQKMKEGWNKFLGQRLAKILDPFKEEMGKRKSILKHEFRKKIQELKQNIFNLLPNI